MVSVQSSVHFSGQDVPDVEGSISGASSHVAAVRTVTKQRHSSAFRAFDERVIGKKLGCIILQSTAAAANSPVSDSGPVSATFKPLGTKGQKRRQFCSSSVTTELKGWPSRALTSKLHNVKGNPQALAFFACALT